ncbi:MAG: hypothetical protein Q8Q23_05950 [bacterium]|nr:hypothetical protein [bacterium]
MNKTTTISLLSVLALTLIFNQWQLSKLSHMKIMVQSGGAEQMVSDTGAAPDNALSTDITALAQKLIARGIPPVYGAELGVSFDDAAAAIPVLSRFEQDSRPNKLTGDKLARYIKIGQSISCEFCCSATTMVFPDGSRACGCAHSAAMRGVAAYLLDTQGDKMSDTQILTEVSKWKSVYFPGPTIKKYLAQSGQTGLPTGQAGGSSQALPSQVGGC